MRRGVLAGALSMLAATAATLRDPLPPRRPGAADADGPPRCWPPRCPPTARPTSCWSTGRPRKGAPHVRAATVVRRRARGGQERAARSAELPQGRSRADSRRRRADRRRASNGRLGDRGAAVQPGRHAGDPRTARRRRGQAGRGRSLARPADVHGTAARGRRQHAAGRRAGRHQQLGLADPQARPASARRASPRRWRRRRTSPCAPSRCAPSTSTARARTARPGRRRRRPSGRRRRARWPTTSWRRCARAARWRWSARTWSQRLAGVAVATTLGVPAPNALGRLRDPNSWHAFPGWTTVKPQAGPNGVGAEVEDSLPFVDLEATWRAEPGGSPRWTATGGVITGARTGLGALPARSARERGRADADGADDVSAARDHGPPGAQGDRVGAAARARAGRRGRVRRPHRDEGGAGISARGDRAAAPASKIRGDAQVAARSAGSKSAAGLFMPGTSLAIRPAGRLLWPRGVKKLRLAGSSSLAVAVQAAAASSIEQRSDADRRRRPRRKTCDDYHQDYVAAVRAAKVCNAAIDSVQCQHLVSSSLGCGCPTTVNDRRELDRIVAGMDRRVARSRLVPRSRAWRSRTGNASPSPAATSAPTSRRRLDSSRARYGAGFGSGAARRGLAQLADAGAADRLLRAGRIGRHHLRARGVGAALLAILLVRVLLLLRDRALLAALAARTAVVGDRDAVLVDLAVARLGGRAPCRLRPSWPSRRRDADDAPPITATTTK